MRHGAVSLLVARGPALAADPAAFIDRMPLPGFLPDCVAVAGYPTPAEAVAACRTEWHERLLDRVVGTLLSAAAAMLVFVALRFTRR